MSRAFDVFEQIWDARGALPTRNACIVEDGNPARLSFALFEAGEAGDVAPNVLTLEMLGEADAGERARAGFEALASRMGPLFDGGGPESLESWQLAVGAAQLGMGIHAAIQQTDASLLLSAVGKRVVVDAKRDRRRGCWHWVQVPVDAGGGEYRCFLPAEAWSRQMGEGRWAFVQTGSAPDFLDSLTVGVLQLDFRDASLADAEVVADALRQSGLPAAGGTRWNGDKGVALIGSPADLRFEKAPYGDKDIAALSDMLRAMAQARMGGARLDMIKSTAEQQFMAFSALLGYLWFDFVRRGKEAKVGICAECGLPFGKSSRGGSCKRFCSPGCSTKYRNREKREEKR